MNDIDFLQKQLNSREPSLSFLQTSPNWRINQTIQRIASSNFSQATGNDLLRLHDLYERATTELNEGPNRSFFYIHIVNLFRRLSGLPLREYVTPTECLSKAIHSDSAVKRKIVL